MSTTTAITGLKDISKYNYRSCSLKDGKQCSKCKYSSQPQGSYNTCKHFTAQVRYDAVCDLYEPR